MKTKISSIIAVVLAAITALLLYSSCNKNSDCQVLYAMPNPFIYLELKNSQNKNLLDPTIPGHYDTALIKKLNTGKIYLSRPGFSPVSIGFDYIGNQGTSIISLSNTDQDTLNISTETTIQQCNTYYKFMGIQYNGISLKPDSGSFYIAHK